MDIFSNLQAIGECLLDEKRTLAFKKAIKEMMKKNDVVLDVCCGRSLLLPMMRYYAKEIKKYIGVDIEEKNLEAKKKNICNNKPIDPKTYYPFETEWVITNVAEMTNKIISF